MGALSHIPRSRLALHAVLYALLFALLARALPWYFFIPVAIVLAAVHLTVESRSVSRRYQTIVDNIRGAHGDVLTGVGHIDPQRADEGIYKTFKELVTELERKNFQLVEKNIQLLSIKEIGLTLVSSLDEAKVVDAVINFLSKGLGYREVFVGIFQPERDDFNFYVFRDTPNGLQYEETALPIVSADGLLRKSLQMHHSLLIRDPEVHAIGRVGGEPLFADSTMKSYLIVPLVKSNATQDCDKRAQCILAMNQVEREATSIQAQYRCPGCDRVPILGVLGVTDGFKAATLSKVDLVSVETLAVQLSTMLENNRLFAELKQEETYRDNVINSMLNGLVTVGVDGRVLFANEAASRITGYGVEELRGMNIDRLITASQTGEGENPLLRTLSRGRKSIQHEAWVIRKGGRSDPIILNTSFLLDERRAVQGVLAVFDDIAHVRRMEEQIVHLEKLAALGRFSSSIAHEIRNPLTGIAAGIQYLKRAGHVADGQGENIDFILEEVSRIDRLIGDLMNVVRIGDLLYTRADVDQVVRSAVATLAEPARQRGVTLRVECPSDGPLVEIDVDRVTQVMINLLKNAIEASSHGSEVTVTVSFPTAPPDVLFDAVRDFVIIEVRDRGLGIAEEDKSRVFEPFFSNKAEGTGLGLYVTHSIVERHGGYIYVDSRHGEGATFTVYLPVDSVHHGGSSEVSNPTG